MKQLIMIIAGVAITLGALAGGPRITGGNKTGGAPTKVIVVRPRAYYPYGGFGYGYRPFFSPYYSYNPFYVPYGYRRPSKLDLDVQQINNDYHHEIAEVRHDRTLPAGERRAKIRDLRHERQNSIIEAKKGYYKRHSSNDDVIE